MNEWKTDEFGNRRWHHDGWTIDHWSSGAVDVEGPEGESIDLDGDVVSLVHEAPYEGSVGVSVPVLVLLESIRLIHAEPATPAPAGEGPMKDGWSDGGGVREHALESKRAGHREGSMLRAIDRRDDYIAQLEALLVAANLRNECKMPPVVVDYFNRKFDETGIKSRGGTIGECFRRAGWDDVPFPASETTP